MRLSVSVVDGGSLPLGRRRADSTVVALPVGPARGAVAAAEEPILLPTYWSLPDPLADEAEQLLRDLRSNSGAPGLAAAGRVQHLPRPTRDPAHVLLFGVGDRRASAWREVGAALYRAAADRHASVAVALPVLGEEGADADAEASAARELALGAWLAAYRFELPVRRVAGAAGADRADGGDRRGRPALRRVILVTRPGAVEVARAAIAEAQALAESVALARDLTNTPGSQKSPKWFADRIVAAANRRRGVSVTVLDEADLADGGFGGVLAVGRGSPRPPRLVELSWRPRGARAHVVLAGKGICFDTGGISIKPLDGMRLMRKDMGGAAAVCATVLAAADLALPIRVTALAPLAENMVSGSSMRPGDVIRHYGGVTAEVLDTDAEGRLVLGDALAYAAKRLRPDWLVDLATLTGASHVALGKRTAALFSGSPELAEALRTAGDEAGEPVWPLPLPDDYLGLLRSDVADIANVPQHRQAGTIVAALYLRELAGDHRDRWAHIDMSAPSWSDRDDGPLVKGATGWGVRLLVRFLASLAQRPLS
jgi:leucyl aminopeptidase